MVRLQEIVFLAITFIVFSALCLADNVPHYEWTFEQRDYGREQFETGLYPQPVTDDQIMFIIRHKENRFSKARWIDNDTGLVLGESYDIEIPDTLDLRPKISRIENQGGIGSCWAFSLVANLWDHLLLAGKDPGRLSQQYLTRCSKYCHGGWFDAANEFIYPKGVPAWDEVPYTASCRPACKRGTPRAWVKEWYFVGRNPSPVEIQWAMLAAGQQSNIEAVPSSVTVRASFGSYGSGIFNNCSSLPTNHMVNIVGWDNRGCTPDVDGYYPTSCRAYWIMRNSWGDRWGESGYMRIQMSHNNSKSKCNRIGEHVALYVLDTDDKPIPPPPPPPPPPTPWNFWDWLMSRPILAVLFFVVCIGGVVMIILLLCGVFSMRRKENE